MQPAHHIRGACHCGNIRFKYSLPDSVGQVRARACGCGFCTRHGGVYTSNSNAELEISVADPVLLSRYRFGTKTADFLVCARCGVVPAVTCDIDGQTFAVVNTSAFIDPVELDGSRSDFEGESSDSRLARRKQNWIPAVTLVTDDNEV